MLNKKLFLPVFVFWASINLFAQENTILNDHQFDQSLMDGLKEIIIEIKASQEKNPEFDFKERGYLNVRLLSYNTKSNSNEPIFTFGVSDEYLSFKDRKNSMRLIPSKYNFIDSKMVLYYFPSQKLGKDEKKKFFRLINEKSNVEKISGKISGYNEKFYQHPKYILEINANYNFHFHKN